MKTRLLTLILLLGSLGSLHAQLPDYIIDDFEGETKNYMLPYGGEIEIIADPLDETNKVLRYERLGSEVYGSIFAREDDGLIEAIPVGPNADQYRYGVVRILKTTTGPCRLKVEGGLDGAITVENNPTTAPWRAGEWQTFIFDFGVKNQDGKTPSGIYKTVGLMPDRSPAQPDSIVSYIDDIYFTQNKPILSFTEQIVSGFGVKFRTSTSLKLGWAAMERAVGYDIYVNDEFLASRLSDETSFEFLEGDLEQGVEYTFEIIAKDVDGIETVPVTATAKLRTKKNDWELINDFEGPQLNYTVWKFDSFKYPVANPSPDDVNASENVLQVRRPVGSGEQYPAGNSYGVVASESDYDIATIGWGSDAYHYMHVKMIRPITHGKPQIKFKFDDGSNGSSDSIVAMPTEAGKWFNYVFVLDSVGESKNMTSYEIQADMAYDDITSSEETRMYYIDDIILCKNAVLNSDISANVTFNVNDGTNPVQGAAVSFNNLFYGTDADGEVVFSDMAAGEYPYTISKEGFLDYDGVVNIVDGDVVEVVSLIPGNSSVSEALAGKLRVYSHNDVLYLELMEQSRLSVEIFDVMGKKVMTLSTTKWMPGGSYEFKTDLPSGIYIVGTKVNEYNSFTKVFIK